MARGKLKREQIDTEGAGNIATDIEVAQMVSSSFVDPGHSGLSGLEGNPHSVTLDQACEEGATTDVAITVSASGSVFNSLKIDNNLHVGGHLYVEQDFYCDWDIYSNSLIVNYEYKDVDAVVYFRMPTSGHQSFIWDKSENRFQISSGTLVQGDVELYNGYLNAYHFDVNAILYFRKPTSGQESLKWDKTDNRFEFSDDLYVGGTITASTSGSVLNSLKVDNNLHVYGDLDVEGDIIGISTTKSIVLPIDGIPPDDSAGNKSAAVERKKSSAGAPSPHFMQTLFDDTIEEFLYWSFRFPGDYGSGLTAKIQYKMVSATLGKVDFDVALMAVTPGSAQDVDADSMDIVNSGNETVPGTAGYLSEISITITNTDSLVAGDFIVIYLKRDADDGTNDTATGDAAVIGFSLEYTPS